MKSEERVNLFFSAAPVVNLKYGFGHNDVVQERITKDVIVYPFFNVPFVDMQPAIVYENNQQYNVMIAVNMAYCLISLASRSGGYHFIDYPLVSFMKIFQIHKSIHFKMEVDFSNSYARFTQPILQPVPFVIPFVFLLYHPFL